ncbi:alpha/beta fold hydrolase [Streptomyces sp. NL15-2K]|uniref:alpha/beta fold hydrolase n=1 Tax=Streptomyces sp. NL15-2K TaxID=376149 RepID=UPI000F55CC48|nr:MULTISPECIES: alpha/beta fold hydrolase [Actinomycetes]WKX08956.1 alpha/beta fold hydrolase [Kutzneria buriramensis]GCB49550.1 3-oxoadipate enol-lactone hydrolase/4-carboxymuconolactone decarboxylase [Streptomyces sp. NL15-2K]
MRDSFPALATTVTGTGPGLLLAHGATGSIEDNFAPVLPALAAAHTVVAPDYPGSGRTPVAAAPLDLDELTDAVVDSAVRRGVGRFAVLGFSLGTLVAVRAAVRHPERVTALVLTAGFARPDDHVLGLLPGWRAEVPPPLHPHIDLIPSLDTTGDLAEVSAPTLVVATTADSMVLPAGSRALAAGIRGARYTEIDSDHVVMVERSEEWLKPVLDFLHFLSLSEGKDGEGE